MILPFSKRAKLLRKLHSLAFYNDKGVEFARHDEIQTKQYRTQAVQKIVKLVQSMPDEQFPPEFLWALDTGSLGEDYAGRYIDVVRQHFRLEA